MAAGVLVALDGLSGGGLWILLWVLFFCMALGLFVNTLGVVNTLDVVNTLVFGFNFCHAVLRDLEYPMQSGQDNRHKHSAAILIRATPDQARDQVQPCLLDLSLSLSLSL